MSNPISTLPHTNTDTTNDEPELEVDELLDGEESIAHSSNNTGYATDATDATDLDVSESADSAAVGNREAKGRSGLIVLVLAVLLIGSVAINLKQSGDVASLETRNSEFEQALTAAVARIDVETARANGAEAALARVDSAVDVVNEKILGLQDALDGLREATVR